MNGAELWQSDGTSVGTTVVNNIHSGSSGSSPSSLTNVNGTLFFRATDGTDGYELWQSDGTSSGTKLVKEIRSGSGSHPQNLTNVNGTLFFSANDGTNGYELWQSDGTSSGTTLVTGILSGSSGSYPNNLANVNGTLFFSADNGTNGFELWSMAVNSRPRLTAFVAAVDIINEDTEAELTFAELLARGDESDVDGTVDAFIVQAVSSGTLKIGTSAGTATAFAVGSNDRIGGTLNAYWTPAGNASGNAIAALTVLAEDNIGGTSIRPVTASIKVTAVADTPGVTNAATFANVQTTSGLVISRNAVDGVEVTHFKITSITGGSLFQNDGTTAISNNEFITFAQANAGLKFTPTLNSTATGHFTVQASTSNVDGGLGGSTVTADITVTLPAPTLTGPAAVTTDQRPTISWNAVSGADTYVVYIRNLSTGADPLLLRAVTGTSFTPTSNLGIGSYDVRVRALSTSGDSSFYSQKLNFRIATPAVFTNVVRFQTSTTPTLSWKPLAGAVKFDLWIDNLSTGQQQVVRDSNVTGTSWTAPTSLPMGSYRAWIRGTDASGRQANQSLPVDFFVLPPVTAVSPVNPTFDQTPTFTWNAVPGAVSYDLYYRNFSTGAATIAQTGIASTSFTPSTNLPTGSYRWNVYAVVQGGYRSLAATVQNFVIGGKPPVLTPQGSTSDTTPTFSWMPVTGAATYDLWVNRIDVPTNKIVFQTGLATTSFTPTTALPIGTYRVWVRAVSTTSQVSPWSTPVNFAIAAVTDEPVMAPGDLLLTQLIVLDEAALLNNEQPSSDAVDVTVVSHDAQIIAQESASHLEAASDQPERFEGTSHNEPGVSRFSVSPSSMASDQADLDALMADTTSMTLLF